MSWNGRRWAGLERPYSSDDVEALRGSVLVEHTLARLGAERLWELLESEPYVPTLGAMTGGQAVQMVKAGLEGIYVSGWQVAADVNLAGHTYPDQSLYPSTSAPALVRRINNALLRADQIATAEGDSSTYWLAPIVADAEAGLRRAAERLRAVFSEASRSSKCTLIRRRSSWRGRTRSRRRCSRATSTSGTLPSSAASGRRKASSGSTPGSTRALARLRALRRHALVRDLYA